jgi:hypothetical protein
MGNEASIPSQLQDAEQVAFEFARQMIDQHNNSRQQQQQQHQGTSTTSNTVKLTEENDEISTRHSRLQQIHIQRHDPNRRQMSAGGGDAAMMGGGLPSTSFHTGVLRANLQEAVEHHRQNVEDAHHKAFVDPVFSAAAAGAATRKAKREKLLALEEEERQQTQPQNNPKYAQSTKEQKHNSSIEWNSSLRRLATTAASAATTLAHVAAPVLKDTGSVVIQSATEFKKAYQEEVQRADAAAAAAVAHRRVGSSFPSDTVDEGDITFLYPWSPVRHPWLASPTSRRLFLSHSQDSYSSELSPELSNNKMTNSSSVTSSLAGIPMPTLSNNKNKDNTYTSDKHDPHQLAQIMGGVDESMEEQGSDYQEQPKQSTKIPANADPASLENAMKSIEVPQLYPHSNADSPPNTCNDEGEKEPVFVGVSCDSDTTKKEGNASSESQNRADSLGGSSAITVETGLVASPIDVTKQEMEHAQQEANVKAPSLPEVGMLDPSKVSAGISMIGDEETAPPSQTDKAPRKENIVPEATSTDALTLGHGIENCATNEAAAIAASAPSQEKEANVKAPSLAEVGMLDPSKVSAGISTIGGEETALPSQTDEAPEEENIVPEATSTDALTLGHGIENCATNEAAAIAASAPSQEKEANVKAPSLPEVGMLDPSKVIAGISTIGGEETALPSQTDQAPEEENIVPEATSTDALTLGHGIENSATNEAAAIAASAPWQENDTKDTATVDDETFPIFVEQTQIVSLEATLTSNATIDDVVESDPLRQDLIVTVENDENNSSKLGEDVVCNGSGPTPDVFTWQHTSLVSGVPSADENDNSDKATPNVGTEALGKVGSAPSESFSLDDAPESYIAEESNKAEEHEESATAKAATVKPPLLLSLRESEPGSGIGDTGIPVESGETAKTTSDPPSGSMDNENEAKSKQVNMVSRKNDAATVLVAALEKGKAAKVVAHELDPTTESDDQRKLVATREVHVKDYLVQGLSDGTILELQIPGLSHVEKEEIAQPPNALPSRLTLKGAMAHKPKFALFDAEADEVYEVQATVASQTLQKSGEQASLTEQHALGDPKRFVELLATRLTGYEVQINKKLSEGDKKKRWIKESAPTSLHISESVFAQARKPLCSPSPSLSPPGSPPEMTSVAGSEEDSGSESASDSTVDSTSRLWDMIPERKTVMVQTQLQDIERSPPNLLSPSSEMTSYLEGGIKEANAQSAPSSIAGSGLSWGVRDRSYVELTTLSSDPASRRQSRRMKKLGMMSPSRISWKPSLEIPADPALSLRIVDLELENGQETIAHAPDTDGSRAGIVVDIEENGNVSAEDKEDKNGSVEENQEDRDLNGNTSNELEPSQLAVNVEGKLDDLEKGGPESLTVGWDEENRMNFPGVPDTEDMTEAFGREVLLDEALLAFSSLDNVEFLRPFLRIQGVSKSQRHLATIRWKQLVANWKHSEAWTAMNTRPCSVHFREPRHLGLPEETNSMSSSTLKFRWNTAKTGLGRTLTMADALSEIRSFDGFSPHPGDSSVLTGFLSSIGPDAQLPNSKTRQADAMTLIQNLTPEDLTDESISVTDLLKVAESKLPSFTNLLQGIVEFSSHNVGMSAMYTEAAVPSFSVGLKNYSSIRKKAARKYCGDILKVKDVLRGQVTFPDEGSLVCGLYFLANECDKKESEDSQRSSALALKIEIVSLKNLFRLSPMGHSSESPLPTGYRHILAKVRIDDQIVAGKCFS